jgi:hypothetical protein
LTRGKIRIADEATHRAWSVLWPDLPDAPTQSDLLDDSHKKPPASADE